MKIAMIGTGYVGLVSGVCFAEMGFDTVCIDKQADKIEGLKAGRMPIYEEGLEEMVGRNHAAGRLTFSTDLPESVRDADAVFIAVGTPSDEQGRADLSAVFGAAREIARAASGYTVVVNKSTVPVGTGQKVAEVIAAEQHAENGEAEIEVASNPEFLREGAAIKDFMDPDRVLIGTRSERAAAALQEIYEPLRRQGIPVIVTDRESSEIAKYAANSFLAAKITFINQVADLCERTGGNVQDVAEAVGMDHRIASTFLSPGPGYGGSCFPKDTRAFANVAREYGSKQDIVDAVIEANENRKHRMAERIIEAAGGSVHGKTVAVLGLTFKANTDDMRDSPSLAIIPALQRYGAHVKAYCPGGMQTSRALFQDLHYCRDAYEAARNADIVTVLTDWAEFKTLDLASLRMNARGGTLVDLRNLFHPSDVLDAGFSYFSIGRPASLAGRAEWHAQGRPYVAVAGE